VNSCIIVREKNDEPDTPLRMRLSPKPELEMSDLFVRSEPGDMVAFIPKDWFFVDVEDKLSSDVIAVAVNQDYTLCVVFKEIKKNEQIDDIVKKEGLIGLARTGLENNIKKSSAGVKQVGNFRSIVLGNNNFVQYETSTTGGAMTAKCVVYQSALNNYYEFSVFPMNFTSKELPTATEVESVYNSILATIKY